MTATPLPLSAYKVMEACHAFCHAHYCTFSLIVHSQEAIWSCRRSEDMGHAWVPPKYGSRTGLKRQASSGVTAASSASHSTDQLERAIMEISQPLSQALQQQQQYPTIASIAVSSTRATTGHNATAPTAATPAASQGRPETPLDATLSSALMAAAASNTLLGAAGSGSGPGSVPRTSLEHVFGSALYGGGTYGMGKVESSGAPPQPITATATATATASSALSSLQSTSVSTAFSVLFGHSAGFTSPRAAPKGQSSTPNLPPPTAAASLDTNLGSLLSLFRPKLHLLGEEKSPPPLQLPSPRLLLLGGFPLPAPPRSLYHTVVQAVQRGERWQRPPGIPLGEGTVEPSDGESSDGEDSPIEGSDRDDEDGSSCSSSSFEYSSVNLRKEGPLRHVHSTCMDPIESPLPLRDMSRACEDSLERCKESSYCRSPRRGRSRMLVRRALVESGKTFLEGISHQGISQKGTPGSGSRPLGEGQEGFALWPAGVPHNVPPPGPHTLHAQPPRILELAVPPLRLGGSLGFRPSSRVAPAPSEATGRAGMEGGAGPAEAGSTRAAPSGASHAVRAVQAALVGLPLAEERRISAGSGSGSGSGSGGISLGQPPSRAHHGMRGGDDGGSGRRAAHSDALSDDTLPTGTLDMGDYLDARAVVSFTHLLSNGPSVASPGGSSMAAPSSASPSTSPAKRTSAASVAGPGRGGIKGTAPTLASPSAPSAAVPAAGRGTLLLPPLSTDSMLTQPVVPHRQPAQQPAQQPMMPAMKNRTRGAGRMQRQPSRLGPAGQGSPSVHTPVEGATSPGTTAEGKAEGGSWPYASSSSPQVRVSEHQVLHKHSIQ